MAKQMKQQNKHIMLIGCLLLAMIIGVIVGVTLSPILFPSPHHIVTQIFSNNYETTVPLAPPQNLNTLASVPFLQVLAQYGIGETQLFEWSPGGIVYLSTTTGIYRFGEGIEGLQHLLDDSASHMDFSRDGQWFYAQSDDNSINVWNIAEHRIERKLQFEHTVTGFALRPQVDAEDVLVVSLANITLQSFSLPGGWSPDIEVTLPQEEVGLYGFSTDGNLMMMSYHDPSSLGFRGSPGSRHTMYFFDLETSERAEFTFENSNYVVFRNFSVSGDGSYLAVNQIDIHSNSMFKRLQLVNVAQLFGASTSSPPLFERVVHVRGEFSSGLEEISFFGDDYFLACYSVGIDDDREIPGTELRHRSGILIREISQPCGTRHISPDGEHVVVPGVMQESEQPGNPGFVFTYSIVNIQSLGVISEVQIPYFGGLLFRTAVTPEDLVLIKPSDVTNLSNILIQQRWIFPDTFESTSHLLSEPLNPVSMLNPGTLIHRAIDGFYAYDLLTGEMTPIVLFDAPCKFNEACHFRMSMNLRYASLERRIPLIQYEQTYTTHTYESQYEIYDLHTGNRVMMLDESESDYWFTYSRVMFSQAGLLLYQDVDTDTRVLYDAETAEIIHDNVPYDVTHYAVHPDRSLIVFCGTDYSPMQLVDVETMTVLREIDLAGNCFFSSDGSRLVVYGPGLRVVLADLR